MPTNSQRYFRDLTGGAESIYVFFYLLWFFVFRNVLLGVAINVGAPNQGRVVVPLYELEFYIRVLVLQLLELWAHQVLPHSF